MPLQANGPGRRTPEPLLFAIQANRRANLTTLANPIKSCGHHRPIFRNVTAPGGAAAYVCRECFAQLRAVEVRAIAIAGVKRQLDNLFRRPWPLGIPGAALASGLEVAR